MLTYGFYNSYEHDRVYDAEQFAMMFDGLIADGVYAHIGQKFAVIEDSTHAPNRVIVQSGRAYFHHTWTYNDSNLVLDMDPPEVYLSRYDAVVIDIQDSNDVRENKITFVKGTPSTYIDSQLVPKPTMINEGGHYQIPLAFIYRPANVNPESQVITTSDIWIVVGGGASYCPYVTGILESFPVTEHYARWAQDWENFKDQYKSDYDAWVTRAEARYNADTTALEQQWVTWRDSQESTFEAWKGGQESDFNSWKTQQRTAFANWMSTQQSDFNDWFENLQYVLDGDVAGHLQNEIDTINNVTLNPLPTSKGGTGNTHGYIETGLQSRANFPEDRKVTVEGDNNNVNDEYLSITSAHIEGSGNVLENSSYAKTALHMEGLYNNARYGTYASHIEGQSNSLEGAANTHVEGNSNIVVGSTAAHAEGTHNEIGNRSKASHIEGENNFIDSSNYSFLNYNVYGYNLPYVTNAHVEGGGDIIYDKGGLNGLGIGLVADYDIPRYKADPRYDGTTGWFTDAVPHVGVEHSEAYYPYHKIVFTFYPGTESEYDAVIYYNGNWYLENDDCKSEEYNIGQNNFYCYFTLDPEDHAPMYVHYLNGTGETVHCKIYSIYIFEANVGNGQSCHVEGKRNYATGEVAHAEGFSTTAKGKASHSEGSATSAIGHYSHTEGMYTIALGAGSHAGGAYAVAKRDYQFVHGPVGFGGDIESCSSTQTFDDGSKNGIAIEVYSSASGIGKGVANIILDGDDAKFYMLYMVNTSGDAATYMITCRGGIYAPVITQIANVGNNMPSVSASVTDSKPTLTITNNSSYNCKTHLVRYL